jgi:hypothetical protein
MWEKGIKMLPEPSYSKKGNALFISVAVVCAIFFLEILASWALMLRMRLQKSEYFTKTEPRIFLCSTFPIRRASSLASLIDPLHCHLNTREPRSLIQNLNLILNLDTSRYRENIELYSLVKHAIVQNGNVFS